MMLPDPLSAPVTHTLRTRHLRRALLLTEALQRLGFGVERHLERGEITFISPRALTEAETAAIWWWVEHLPIARRDRDRVQSPLLPTLSEVVDWHATVLVGQALFDQFDHERLASATQRAFHGFLTAEHLQRATWILRRNSRLVLTPRVADVWAELRPATPAQRNLYLERRRLWLAHYYRFWQRHPGQAARGGSPGEEITGSMPPTLSYQYHLSGQLHLDPPLAPAHQAYLARFAQIQHLRRDVVLAWDMPDPLREAVALPLGSEGAYFVGMPGDTEAESHPSLPNRVVPPTLCPSLWCPWSPSPDGTALVPVATMISDPGGTFREWLSFVLQEFLVPWGYTLTGVVAYQGEVPGDDGMLIARTDHIEEYPLVAS